MKITCLIDALATGGAQRVITHLAEGLARRGHSVTLTTLNPSIPDFYAIPPGVERASVPLAGGPHRWFNLRLQLRRFTALRKCLRAQAPDIIISFIDTTNILSLAMFPCGKPPVIACERINPDYNGIGPHWRLLRRLLYPRAAKVVMLTEDALVWAQARLPRWNATAIPNPVLPPVFSERTQRPEFFSKPFNLVALGRLNRQKGFDLLIRAFAGLAARHPQWQLTIIGEGPERAALENMVRGSGLEGRVILPGASENPADILRYSDMFVLPSRYEGFPNALTEAMACGLPAVSFDCPSGPAAIVRSGIDGLLVPAEDVGALETALEALMSDENRRKGMALKAAEVIHRFDLRDYLDTWEALLGETAV